MFSTVTRMCKEHMVKESTYLLMILNSYTFQLLVSFEEFTK